MIHFFQVQVDNIFCDILLSLGDIGTLNTSHDMIKMMPKLTPQDVADAVIYAISTPENVLVRHLERALGLNIESIKTFHALILDSRIDHQAGGRVLINR